MPLTCRISIAWCAVRRTSATQPCAASAADLEVSEIFKCYREDFESGYKGITSREQLFARYAALLADTHEQQQRVRTHQADIRYSDYDWRLNAVRR